MMRWLKRLFWLVLILVVAILASSWVQLQRVRGQLSAEQPLALPEWPRDISSQAEGVALRARALAQIGEKVIKLDSEDATVLLRAALRDPAVRKELERGRAQVLAALREVPSAVDPLKGVPLDTLDLTALDGDVRFEGDRATVRLTGPYGAGAFQGKHLNLRLVFGLTWRQGTPFALDLSQLEVGSLDVLSLWPHGVLVRKNLHQLTAQAGEKRSSQQFERIAIAEGKLQLELTERASKDAAGAPQIPAPALGPDAQPGGRFLDEHNRAQPEQP